MPTATASAAPVTPRAAAAFVDSAETVLGDLGVKAGRAAWVQANFITHDTEILAAEANERLVAASTALASQAAQYDGLDLPYDVERKLGMLRTSITLPAPADPAKTAELTQIAARLESTYGRGEYCPPGGDRARAWATCRRSSADRATLKSWPRPGPAGGPSRRPCAAITRAWLSS